MRVLHSVLSLQSGAMPRIKIVWEYSRFFNCSIFELFQVPDDIVVEEWNMTFSKRIKRKFAESLRKTPLSKIMYDLILHEQDIIKLRNKTYNFRDLLNYSSVYIETCQWFYTGTGEFKFFKPNIEIIDQVHQVTSDFNKHIIGIHIRQTDHSLSIKSSPISEFVRIMKNEIKKNNDTIFFLSTDSGEAEKKLKDEFQNRIITYENKELSRNTTKGIKDAFIDMLCLSRTNKIYGSYQSSFSHIASLINGIELQVVNVLDRSKSDDLVKNNIQ